VEKAIIGCVLLDETAMLLAQEHLQPGQTRSPFGELIWPIMCDLHARQQPIDVLHIGRVGMRNRDRWHVSGGMHALMECTWIPPNAVFVEAYGKMHRKMRAEADLERAVAMTGDKQGEQKAELLRQATEDFAKSSEETITGRNHADVADDVLRRIIQAADGKAPAATVLTPWADLNQRLGGGCHKGYVTVVAARPKHGKTAFGELCAEHNSARQIGTLYYSQESPADDHLLRFAQRHGEVYADDLRRGQITQKQAAEALRNVEAAKTMTIRWVERVESGRIGQILSRCQLELARWRQPYECEMVILDHLHEFKADRWLDKEHERIASVFTAINRFSQSTGKAVLLLAQMNRKIVDDATGKKPEQIRLPNAGDLRGAGKIEESAAAVAFIHNPFKLVQGVEQAIQDVCFMVDLSRFGTRGIVKGKRWNGPRLKFEHCDVPQYTGWV
jgi:replicative DNA helicase